MEVTLLGTGSPLPHPDRAGPSTLVRPGTGSFLVDCGRGVLMRLTAAGIPSPAFLDAVLLTHLHSDHVTDFNDVVTSAWAVSMVPKPLRVFGPVGTQAFVDRTLAMLSHDIGYRLAHHDDLHEPPQVEVTEVTDGVILEADGVTITAAPTDHRPVDPTVGYRFDGPGGSACIAGDTVPCDGLDRLCAGVDIYSQTVVRPSMVKAMPAQRLQDILDYHSSIEQAAQTAAKAGAGTLVLTHPVPAPVPGTEQEWIDEAAAHFAGRIVLPDDMTVVSTAKVEA